MGLREEKLVARARLAATPMFFAIVLVEPDAPTWELVAAGTAIALYVAVSGWLSLVRTPSRRMVVALIGGDLLALSVGAQLTDASHSPYPYIALLGLCAIPPGISRRVRGAFYATFAAAIGGPVLADEIKDGVVPAHTLCFCAGLVVAYLLATRGASIERRHRARLSELLRQRAELLEETSRLSERQRRSTSHELHDGVLQMLLAAGQDLHEAGARSGDESIGHAQQLITSAVGTLRTAVTELHPVALAGAKLPDALAAVVEQHRAAGADVRLVAPRLEAAAHDNALFAVIRELLASMVSVGAGAPVVVELRRGAGETVADLRMQAAGGGEPGAAVGAIGVAWARFRLEAVGGALEHVAGAPGETTFRVRVPDGGAPAGQRSLRDTSATFSETVPDRPVIVTE